MSHLNPEIWGPIYWSYLYTVALSFPDSPNDTTKRKYYDLIMNMPLFIPIPNMGNTFARFLDSYPPQPYITSKESLLKWVHFIHNKMNVFLGKPEMSYYEAMDNYYDKYKLKEVKKKEEKKSKHKYIFSSVLFLLIITIIFMYFSK